MLKLMLPWREMQCDLHCRMPDFNTSTSHWLFYEMNIDLSACHMLFPAHVSSSDDLCKAQRPALGAQRLRQAEPTCYMDRHIDHRIFLGPSNSFLLLSCPYWFAPSLPRCVPVVLIKYKHYIPTEWSRWKRTKRKTKTSDIHCDKKPDTTEQSRYSVPTCYKDIWKGHSISLNLLNFSRPPSCLGGYGSCHLQHDQVVLVRTKGWQCGMKFYFVLNRTW